MRVGRGRSYSRWCGVGVWAGQPGVGESRSMLSLETLVGMGRASRTSSGRPCLGRLAGVASRHLLHSVLEGQDPGGRHQKAGQGQCLL